MKTNSGEEGFMAGHTWAVKLLQPGQLRIQEKDEDRQNMKYAAISEGYIVVEDNVTIFTDSRMAGRNRFSQSGTGKERAESRLKQISPDDIEHARLEIALHRAINRIRVKGGNHHHKVKSEQYVLVPERRDCMAVLASYIVPHPPLIVGAVGRGREKDSNSRFLSCCFT